MKVSTETKMMVRLALTEQEEKAFRQTAECIKFLCSTFEKEGNLFSPTTGEVIQTFELRRMLGVLNGLEGNRCWEFEQSRKNDDEWNTIAEDMNPCCPYCGYEFEMEEEEE